MASRLTITGFNAPTAIPKEYTHQVDLKNVGDSDAAGFVAEILYGSRYDTSWDRGRNAYSAGTKGIEYLRAGAAGSAFVKAKEKKAWGAAKAIAHVYDDSPSSGTAEPRINRFTISPAHARVRFDNVTFV
jgi:hypothetical protein